MYYRCAVCGDTHKTNIKLVWRRARDNKYFHICLACAEDGIVNENSVNNYKAGQIKPEVLEQFLND